MWSLGCQWHDCSVAVETQWRHSRPRSQAYSRYVGIARRKTTQFGTVQSIIDDLRLIRSRGGFQFALGGDLLGVRRLPAYRGRMAFPRADARRGLRDHVTHRLTAILDDPKADINSGPIVAAESLRRLLLSTELGPPNARLVREEVGRASKRGHDNVRYHEDRLLVVLAREFIDNQPSAMTEPDIVAGVASLVEALMDISKAATHAIRMCRGTPYERGADVQFEIYNAISDLYFHVVIYVDRTRALIDSIGEKTQIFWVMSNLRLQPWGPFLAFPQVLRNVTWWTGGDRGIPPKKDAESMNVLVVQLWKHATGYDRGIYSESESELHHMRDQSACLAALLPLIASPDFHIVLPPEE